MFTVLIGLNMALHLFAYQATAANVVQTVVPSELVASKPVRVSKQMITTEWSFPNA